MPTSMVKLERFCGDAVFPVRDVEVYVSRPRADERGGVLLNLEINCGKATRERAPEGEKLGWTCPVVEVWIPVPDATAAALDDLRVKIPWRAFEPRDARHRLYVFEHEDLWNLDVRIRHLRGRTCQLSLVGTARDPNHYSGKKPSTRVTAEARFTLEPR